MLYPLDGVNTPHGFHWGDSKTGMTSRQKAQADKVLAKTDTRLKEQMAKGGIDDVNDLLPGDSLMAILFFSGNRSNFELLATHELLVAVQANEWRHFAKPRVITFVAKRLVFICLFFVSTVGLSHAKWWRDPDLFTTDPSSATACLAVEALWFLGFLEKFRTELYEMRSAKGWFGYFTQQRFFIALGDNCPSKFCGTP